MSKKSKNVFEKVEEKLDSLLEEMQTANSILYALGSEMFDIGDKIDSLSAKVEALTGEPLKVTVDVEQLRQALEKQTKPAEAKEVFKVSFGKTVEGE